MRHLMAILVFLVVVLVPLASSPTVSAADCQYVLGFKTLHDMIPSIVGDCSTDEYHNTNNGDALQKTWGVDHKEGLLVWRKADNWTAYTDGHWTWVNGPHGLQKRLNTVRFTWEVEQTIPVVAEVQPTPIPTPIPPIVTPMVYQPMYQCGNVYRDRVGLDGYQSASYKIWANAGHEVHASYRVYPTDTDLMVIIYDSNGTRLFSRKYVEWGDVWYIAPYHDVYTVKFYNPSIAKEKTAEISYWVCGVW